MNRRGFIGFLLSVPFTLKSKVASAISTTPKNAPPAKDFIKFMAASGWEDFTPSKAITFGWLPVSPAESEKAG